MCAYLFILRLWVLLAHQWIYQLFESIDSKDAKKFMTFLAPSSVFRFGNIPPVEGNENIENFISHFFASIEAISHELVDIFDVPEGKLCHGFVSYTRKNNTILTVPFANLLKGSERNITEYLIFADTSKLYDDQ